jgi:stage II sporulation protein GA (sporulation sigma-E factor processing peptidase)
MWLLNFLADLAWFWLTARLAGAAVRFWRLVLTAAVGAAAAVWATFPGGRWLNATPGVLLGTIALLALAFWPCSLRQALRVGAVFLFVGGSMAGMVLLLAARLPAFPTTLDLAGVLLCLVGGRHVWEAVRDRARVRAGIYRLRVRLGETTVEIGALLDTGNGLKEPLTGRPVAVVEARALAELLPMALLEAVAGDGAEARWDRLLDLPEPWAAQLRTVPFRAVGRPAGTLFAFAPGGLAIRAPGEEAWREVRGLVGLAAEPLDPDGAYRALLPPRMLG